MLVFVNKYIPSSIISFFPLFLILLLATLLRFYNLAGQSLWSDEGNSIALARHSFSEIAQRTAFDIHPPLYYWLLKLWTILFDDSEIALRSLSALLGVGLVYLIWWLGQRLFNQRVGLIAAFIAALSPFQVYYAQEARMYMLLTVLGTLTVVATVLLMESVGRGTWDVNKDGFYVPRFTSHALFYISVVTAGLYTHYAFLVILVVVNLTVVWFIYRLIHHSQFTINNLQFVILPWLALQLIPWLLYLPWLPTAWRQITTWPSVQQSASFLQILTTSSTTLLFGLSWPYALGILSLSILTLLIIYTLYLIFPAPHPTPHTPRPTPHIPRPTSLLLLSLWLLLPIIITIIIYSPAFLKFLLSATPSLALLLAVALHHISIPRFLVSSSFDKAQDQTPHPLIPLSPNLASTLLTLLAGASLLSLHHYYTNPIFARDNYRGIVQFIKAVGGADDAVILNAEGQQDVFNYYYQPDSLPSQPDVYPLPRQRPLDESATLHELQAIGSQSSKVYGVYWATQQADPNGLIEGWLDSNLFKATDQWYGNVRLVSYAGSHSVESVNIQPVDYQLGEDIQLTGYGVSALQIAPGDILQVALHWQTDVPIIENYTVFLQLLDEANHLVGQRDAQPQPSAPDWPLTETVVDTHGLFIEPGTPPGQHRLIAGLYNSQTGQRLPIDEADVDFIELGQIEIVPPVVPLPVEAFNMQFASGETVAGLELVGYDFYKLGHRSASETVLHSGDPVQLVTYWRRVAGEPLSSAMVDIRVVNNFNSMGDTVATYPVAGVHLPGNQWRNGEIIRAQYDFFLPGLSPGVHRVVLSLGNGEIITKPFLVE